MSDLPLNADGAPGYGDASAVTPSSPGAVLSASRQAYGLTIEQVASQLNLAPRQVVALETDNFAALPGMVIARGFLRAYAKLLKLDPVPLLAALGDPYQASSSVPMRHALSTSFSESRMPSLHSAGARNRVLPGAIGLVVLVAVAAASYALGWWPESVTRRVSQLRAGLGEVGNTAAPGTGATPSTAGGSTAAAQSADVTDTTGVAPGTATADAAGAAGSSGPAVLDASGRLSNTLARTDGGRLPSVATGAAVGSAGSTGPTTAPMTASVPANALSATLASQNPGAASASKAGAGSAPLVLNFTQDSWVEIKRANNTVVIAKMIKAGAVESFELSEPVTLIIGNIAGVQASLRGAPLDLGKSANGNVAKLRLK